MVYFRGFLKNLFKKTLYLLFGNFVGYKVDILENFNQRFDKSFFYYISLYLFNDIKNKMENHRNPSLNITYHLCNQCWLYNV